MKSVVFKEEGPTIAASPSNLMLMLDRRNIRQAKSNTPTCLYNPSSTHQRCYTVSFDGGRPLSGEPYLNSGCKGTTSPQVEPMIVGRHQFRATFKAHWSLADRNSSSGMDGLQNSQLKPRSDQPPSTWWVGIMDPSHTWPNGFEAISHPVGG